eukprot:13933146-Alexandrium_andersonii.AAC.1
MAEAIQPPSAEAVRVQPVAGPANCGSGPHSGEHVIGEWEPNPGLHSRYCRQALAKQQLRWKKWPPCT